MLKGKGVLSDFQKAFLRLFASLPDQKQFYLTGGTALAEYFLGHRISYDLDLFTSEAELILPFSHQVEQAVQQAGYRANIIRRFNSFVEFQITQGEEALKIDLALDSPFRLAPVELGDAGVMVNDFLDIQADKTLAFFGRAEPRDAIDLYFLLQSTSFEQLAELARQKDAGFDLYWFAVALNRTENFPDELERWPVQMLVKFDPVALKRSFQSMAMQILAKQTGKS
ncbi:MAG: nucleotidyl transferase AbiEii/AbiGii toxin family protein [Anaerolineales bacterium]|nr:nucleotidyl transferase AbiEii/AbiGii toxin family protein [Anaerolineales bacterium]